MELNCLLFVLFSVFSVSRTVSCENVTRTNSIEKRKDVESEYIQVPPPNCSSCLREDIKNRNIEAIKSEVLKKLGLDRPPNITRSSIVIPAHLRTLIETTNRGYQNDQSEYDDTIEEDDEFHVKTEKIITFAQPYKHIRHSKDHDVLYFSLSESITKFQVVNASLYVFVRGTEKRPPPIMTVEIFKLYKSDPQATIKMLHRKITQPYGRDEWYKLDVTVMVSEWFKSPKDNMGFIINGTVEGKKISLVDKTNDANKKLPYVEISTRETKRRIRRQSNNCEETSPSTICCRYPLTIDFEQFGWDFILFPKRYEAHYCAGKCNYFTMQKHPHTHLATMAAPDIATPCCAPRKMSAISMLYFDLDYNIVYGSLKGMVVDRCGCS